MFWVKNEIRFNTSRLKTHIPVKVLNEVTNESNLLD